MKQIKGKRRIGYLLGLTLLVVALFVTMAVAASATTVHQVGSTAELEAAAAKLAENDTIQLTQSFELTAKEPIKLGTKVWITSAAGGPYTITRTVPNMPMFDNVGGFVWINNVIIDGNNVEDTTSNGGAFTYDKAVSKGNIYIGENVTFKNLNAKNGGAIYAAWPKIEGSNVVFTNCSAVNDGGAIYGFYSLEIKAGMKGVEIKNNKAGHNGGGLYVYASTSARVHLKAGTFSGNEATSGGAIYNGSKVQPCSYINLTVTGNTADLGAGIYQKGAAPTVVTGVTFTGNMLFGGGVGEDLYADMDAVLNLKGGVTTIDTIANAGSITLTGDLEEGSNIQLRGTENIKVADGFTPNKDTLAALRLAGADVGYAASVKDGTIVFPTETMQVIMRGRVSDVFEIWFGSIALRDASKRENMKICFDGKELAPDAIVTLSPKQITEEIVFKSGDTVLGTYSFAYYMERLQEEYAADSKEAVLAGAIINYGSAAQTHFDYNMDNVANIDYPMDLEDEVSGTGVYEKDDAKCATKIASAEFSFDSKAVIKVNVTNWKNGCRATVNGIDVTDRVRVSGKNAVISGVGIKASNLENEITVVITNGGEKATLTYSLLDYALAVEKDEEASGSLLYLTRAACAYAEAAKAFVPAA